LAVYVSVGYCAFIPVKYVVVDETSTCPTYGHFLYTQVLYKRASTDINQDYSQRISVNPTNPFPPPDTNNNVNKNSGKAIPGRTGEQEKA
jgi:hypothetical protein